MALETSSGFKKTSTRDSSSLISILLILAGFKDRCIRSCMFVVQGITSIFSFLSSLTIPCILEPFMPTQAPTGSILSS